MGCSGSRSGTRQSRVRALAFGGILALCLAAVDAPPNRLHPGEVAGAALIRHRADIIDAGNGRHLWPVYSEPGVRINYFEVTGPTALHFHPDADHRLYVLEGELLLTAGTNTTTARPGDFIVIPKGVRHRYDVATAGGRALLLTLDAPPYDPRKTVNIEAAEDSKTVIKTQ